MLALRIFSIILLFLGGVCSSSLFAADTDSKPRFGNVLVVANGKSPLSRETAVAYRKMRNLSRANQLNVSLSKKITLSRSEFSSKLLPAVQQRLNQLDREVDYIVLMRGVPYRTGNISTGTALFFRGVDQLRSLHGYYGRQDAFDSGVRYLGRKLYPTTVISGYTIEDIMNLIKRSDIRYDDISEAGTFYLCEGVGPRGVRNKQIEAASRFLRKEGAKVKHIRDYNIGNRDDVLVQFTGITILRPGKNNYLKGSVIDNLTSFGGYLLKSKSQTSVLTFIAHGACGAYGTVHEPTNNPSRFATLAMPIKYARGFNLADSYYQTVKDWKFGCLVGDPLMAPFAKPAEMNVEPAGADSSKQIEEGEEKSFRVKVKEGIEDEGIASMEVWLDDQYRVMNWEPKIPADTECRLTVKRGNKQIAEMNHTTTSEITYRKVLQKFAAGRRSGLKIIPEGKDRDRIFVRIPASKPDPGHKFVCTFSFHTPEKNYKRTQEMTVHPLLTKSLLLDFGSSQVRTGDRITAIVKGHKITVEAGEDENTANILKRFAEKLSSLSLFGQSGEISIKLRKQQDENQASTRFQIFLFSKKFNSNKTVPLRVKVSRTEGSRFAKNISGKKLKWRLRPIAAFAETAIHPFLPTKKLDRTVSVPAELLSPGAHKLRFIAETPRSVASSEIVDFTVRPKDSSEMPSLKINKEVLEWGDELSFEINPHGVKDDSYARLVVDGEVVSVLPPGTTGKQLRINKDTFAPGKHRVHVEWTDKKEIPDFMEQRQINARSSVKTFWVKRPVRYDVNWKPKKAEAGKKITLEIDGPYLAEGAYVKINRTKVNLERKSKKGSAWIAEIPPLEEGEYDVYLETDSEKYFGGKLKGSLVIERVAQASSL